MIPPPPTTTPPSIHPSSYRSVRDSELDAIRRRGLAKIFNKHFSTVSDTISREREVAEAALEEIEKRKADLAANPRAFQGNHGNGDWNLTQLDQLYLELSKRKAEVQRKERETQELYKRYVSQYGINDNLAITASIKKNASSKYTPLGTGSLTPITNETIDVSSLPSDVVQQADVLLLKIAQRKAALTSSAVGQLTKKKIEEKSRSNHVMNTAIALTGKYPEDTINFLGDLQCMSTPIGDERHSLSHSEFSMVNPTISVRVRTEWTPESTAEPSHVANGKVIDNDFLARDLGSSFISRGVMPEIPENEPMNRSTPQIVNEPNTPADTSVSKTFSLDKGDSPSMASDVHCDDDFDADSNLSALTDIDGVTMAEAEWRLTEFLRTETENIRKMFITEPSYEQLIDDDADSNTVFSTESKRSMVATLAAEKMARSMAEASSWMHDPTILTNEDDLYGKEDDAIHADNEITSNTCEWHAYWSAEHNREYYFNINTKQTCWSRPQCVMIDTSTLTLTQGKMLSYAKDEIVAEVKDFSKKVVSVVSKKRNDAMSENIEMIDLYKPDSVQTMADSSSIMSGGTLSSKRSKLSAYRNKMIRRQKRNQRLLVVVFVGLAASILFFYTQKLRRDKLISERSLAEAERSRIEIEAEKRRLQDEERKLQLELDRLKWINHHSLDDVVYHFQEKEPLIDLGSHNSLNDDEDRKKHEMHHYEEQELLPLDLVRQSALGTVPTLHGSEENTPGKELSQDHSCSSSSITTKAVRLTAKDALSDPKALESDDSVLGHDLGNEIILYGNNERTASETAIQDHSTSLSKDVSTKAVSLEDDNSSALINFEQGDHPVSLTTPAGCRIPFAYIFSSKCRTLAEKKHWLDVEWIDSMLQ